jgi:hypothetical protein
MMMSKTSTVPENKYWIESSYEFEDTEQMFNEELIVAVDKGEGGTESIASFPLESRESLNNFIEYLNA